MLGRVWIADRGMAGAKNLAWLRESGRRYIVGAPKSELKKFGSELARLDGWRMVQEGVEVRLARDPETDETRDPDQRVVAPREMRPDARPRPRFRRRGQHQ